MGLIELARWSSVLRGLNYYSNKNVLSWENVGIDTYSGVVLGSNDNKYEVYIDINHPRKSKCNCPLRMEEELYVTYDSNIFYCKT